MAKGAAVTRGIRFAGLQPVPLGGVEVTLGELQAMAVRQQAAIEAQARALAAREQRLRFLRSGAGGTAAGVPQSGAGGPPHPSTGSGSQQSGHEGGANGTMGGISNAESVAAAAERLRRLRERVEAQETKLRRLRALRGQVDQQKMNNAALTSDLDSIRALFNEKEKELCVAVAKVEELTRQLEEVRRGGGLLISAPGGRHLHVQNGGHPTGTHGAPPSAVAFELNKLRTELMYRNKVNEQQSVRMRQQREALSQRQEEMSRVDRRISELQERLHRKRLLNQQLAGQIGGHATPATAKKAAPPLLPQFHAPPNQHHRQQQTPQGLPPKGSSVPTQQQGGHPLEGAKGAQTSVQGKAPQQQTVGKQGGVGVAGDNIQGGSKRGPQGGRAPQHQGTVRQPGTGEPTTQALGGPDVHHVGVHPEQRQHHQGMIPHQGPKGHGMQSKSQDDLLAKVVGGEAKEGVGGDGAEFGKGDPKYQTLPYNTKFTAVNFMKSGSKGDSGSAAVPEGGPGPSGPGPSGPGTGDDVHRYQTQHQNLHQQISQPPHATSHQQHHSQVMNNVNNFSPNNINNNAVSVNNNNNNNNNNNQNQQQMTTHTVHSTPAFSAAKGHATALSNQGNTITQGDSTINSQQQASSSFHVTGNRAFGMNNMRGQPVGGCSNNSNSQGGGPVLHLSPPPASADAEGSSSSSRSSTSSKPALPPKPALPAKPTPPPRQSPSNAAPGAHGDMVDASLGAVLRGSGPPMSKSKMLDLNPSVVWTSARSQERLLSNSRDDLTGQQGTVPTVPPPPPPPPPPSPPVSQPPSEDSNEEPAKRGNAAENGTNASINGKSSKRLLDPGKGSFPSSLAGTGMSGGGGFAVSQLDHLHHHQHHGTVQPQQVPNFSESGAPVPSPQHSSDVGTSVEEQSQLIGGSLGSPSEDAQNPSSPSGVILRRAPSGKKGNLKIKGGVGGRRGGGAMGGGSGRRVSFDPLALLLDASLEGELELVRRTAAQVADPSAANDEGITALHNAICAGHLDIVRFLVEFGCDVNAQDSDGWTPLHCAASCNNVAMVRFLVEAGACIFATTLSDRETAAEKCEEDEEGFDGCSEYLYSVQEKLGILNGGAVFSVFDYEAQNPDELSFKEGQRLLVLRKGDESEREWWWARKDGGRGLRRRRRGGEGMEGEGEEEGGDVEGEGEGTPNDDRETGDAGREDKEEGPSEGDGEEGYVPRNLLGLYPRVPLKRD